MSCLFVTLLTFQYSVMISPMQWVHAIIMGAGNNYRMCAITTVYVKYAITGLNTDILAWSKRALTG